VEKYSVMEQRTLFTFNRKSHTTLTLEQLQKTCIYLSIDYQNQTKQQLSHMLQEYFIYYDILPHRISIKYQNHVYYINIPLDMGYKYATRTYIDNTREVYHLMYNKTSGGEFITYSNFYNTWIGYRYNDTTLNRIKNAYTFLDLQNLYIILYYLNINHIFLKDICNYIFTHYKYLLNLPYYYTLL